MPITLHIRSAPDGTLHITEYGDLVKDYVLDAASTFISNPMLVSIKAKAAGRWLIKHLSALGSDVVVGIADLPVTIVATGEAVTYRYRDVSFRGQLSA